MARFGLSPSTPPPDPVTDVEYTAWFRFPVTWSYLTTVAEAAPVLPSTSVVAKKAASPSPSSSLGPGVMTLVSTAPPLPETTVIPPDLTAARPAAAAQWEMVIPKMTRPPARTVQERLPAPPAPPAALAAPSAPSAPPAKAPASPDYTPPSLLQFTPDGSFFARFWKQIALAAGVVLLGAFAWQTLGSDASAHKSPLEWSHRYSTPPQRLLSLYEPSRGESDYSLEFAWVPDITGAGFVLRAIDENNYYATRLTLQQPAPNLQLAEEHFSVRGGVEGTHSRKVISLANHTGPVQIQMDAIGSAFTLSVEGHPVDYWNDSQLDSGPLGFFDETGERPAIQSVHVTLIKKGATRTAVVSLP